MVAELRTALPVPVALRGRGELVSWVLATLGCSLVVAWFMLASPQFNHWFVLPILLCGVLVGKDAMDWALGRIDPFDPAAIFGLFGVHALFISYLLTVYYGTEDFWWAMTPPPDWREWLGYMAWLNLAGLLIYRFVRRLRFSYLAARPAKVVWRLDGRRFWWVWLVLVPVLVGCVAFVFIKVGGYAGYVAAREIEEADTGVQHPLESYGWAVSFAERLPSVLWLGLVVWLSRRRKPVSWPALLLALLALFVLQFAIAGPRGSRSGVLFALVEGVVLLHFWVRPVPRQLMVVGVALMMVFVYLYGFYKAVALDALPVLWSSQARARLAEETGRSLQKVLLDDTSRAGWQAYLLYRVERPGSDYQYALGRTYAAAFAYPLPRRLWPNKPVAKQIEAGQIVWGSYATEWGITSNRVLGLQAEALLNFGPLSIPFSFVLPGVMVNLVRRWVRSWGPGDSRLLFTAFLIPWPMRILHGDSANLLKQLVRYAIIMLPIVLISSRRCRRRPTRASL